MTTLRNFLIAITIMLTLGLNIITAQYNDYHNQGSFQQPTNQQYGNHQNNPSNGNLNWLPSIGSDGKIYSYLPLPQGWQVNDGTNPNQPWIHFGREVQVFQTGTQLNMGRPMSVDQMFNQHFGSVLEKQKATFKNNFPIPAIDQNMQALQAQLYTNGYSQKHIETKGYEYEFPNGINSLIIVTITADLQMGSWYGHIVAMDATSNKYASAKESLIFALSNRKSNPQQLAEYNQNERRLEKERWDAYNSTRRSSSTSGYTGGRGSYSSGGSGDNGTQSFIDGVIYEEEKVSGGGYGGNVSMHNKHTWINSNGEYIQSNDEFYNPNMDPSRNNMNWTRGQRQ